MLFFFCDSSRSGAYVDPKTEIPPREAGDGHEEPDTVHSDSHAGQIPGKPREITQTQVYVKRKNVTFLFLPQVFFLFNVSEWI